MPVTTVDSEPKVTVLKAQSGKTKRYIRPKASKSQAEMGKLYHLSEKGWDSALTQKITISKTEEVIGEVFQPDGAGCGYAFRLKWMRHMGKEKTVNKDGKRVSKNFRSAQAAMRAALELHNSPRVVLHGIDGELFAKATKLGAK